MNFLRLYIKNVPVSFVLLKYRFTLVTIKDLLIFLYFSCHFSLAHALTRILQRRGKRIFCTADTSYSADAAQLRRCDAQEEKSLEIDVVRVA